MSNLFRSLPVFIILSTLSLSSLKALGDVENVVVQKLTGPPSEKQTQE